MCELMAILVSRVKIAGRNQPSLNINPVTLMEPSLRSDMMQICGKVQIYLQFCNFVYICPICTKSLPSIKP